MVPVPRTNSKRAPKPTCERSQTAKPKPKPRDSKPLRPPAPRRKRRPRTIVIPVWDGETDGDAMNERLLDIIRSSDAKETLTEAEQARRARMDRRLLNKLHHTLKVCTIPTLAKWCNARRIGLACLIHLAAESLRVQATPR